MPIMSQNMPIFTNSITFALGFDYVCITFVQGKMTKNAQKGTFGPIWSQNVLLFNRGKWQKWAKIALKSTFRLIPNTFCIG